MNDSRVIRMILAVMAVVLLMVLLQTSAVACPTCKDGLAEGEEHVARGYFWSILFMMSMPFLILSGLGTYFYLSIRRARAAAERPDAAPAATADKSPAGEVVGQDERESELLEV